MANLRHKYDDPETEPRTCLVCSFTGPGSLFAPARAKADRHGVIRRYRQNVCKPCKREQMRLYNLKKKKEHQ